MSKILHLAAKDSDLSKIHGTVGLLCEFAPDSPSLRVAESSIEPQEMLRSPDDALATVSPLVSKLLWNAPRIEGFPPLSIFEETLLEQFSYIAQAFNLDRWISSEGFSACRFASYTPWLDRLRDIREIMGSTYDLQADLPVLETSKYGRFLHRLWRSRPTAREFLRRVAPLWSRCLSANPKRRDAEEAVRGGIWFYSTAYNYTKVGLEYEPYLPQPMNYLVEDPATGGKRLQEVGRESHILYSWARASDIPSRSEVRSMGEQITSAISAVPLSETENTLRSVFLRSEWWQLFVQRWLGFLIFNNRALQRWYREVAPEMIVVGNAGYERALLMHEGTQVPVVMLQHGIMHWVFAVADQPVDVFVVRGPFFQRVINDGLRRKTLILNFPGPDRAVVRQGSETRDSILFITTPYDVPQLYHHDDRTDILRSLLKVSQSTGRKLVIRVHPLERIADYERAVAELQSQLGLHADVSYSQGPGVEEVLARTSVAVLHFSTMFLDCLRHGIPIVSFRWHWFPNQRAFEEEGVFNFAHDLRHFEDLIAKGIEGKLQPRSFGLEHFLAKTEPGEISRFFQQTWERRNSPERIRLLASDSQVPTSAGLQDEREAG